MPDHRTAVRHPAHLAAMLAKADRIATAIRAEFGDLVDADTVARLPEPAWRQIAEITGENVPSEATRQLIVNQLRLTDDTTSDPFACFAGMDR